MGSSTIKPLMVVYLTNAKSQLYSIHYNTLIQTFDAKRRLSRPGCSSRQKFKWTWTGTAHWKRVQER